jgi:spermidine synthase
MAIPDGSGQGGATPVARAGRRPQASPSSLRLWRVRAMGVAGALVLALALLAIDRAGAFVSNDGLTIVETVESLYNDITLYRRSDGYYVLTFGAKRLHYVESIVNPKDELELPVYYTQSMTAGLAYAAGLDDAAIIGLGGGRTAWYFHKSVPALHMTAVELDPDVARLAEKFLNVRVEPNFDIAIKDGRVYLSRNDKLFDVILIDAYRGPFVPFHLLTTEFYKLVGAHLKPGGVAVQNVEPTTMLFDSAVATIKAAFDHVVFFEGNGNIVVLAYDGPEKGEATIEKLAAERQIKYDFRYDLAGILGRRFAPRLDETTKPLTDDFAPVEYLKAVERHNEKQK